MALIRCLSAYILLLLLPASAVGFEDRSSDLSALPEVPIGFEVSVYAQDPLIRSVCSLAFDERGRMYVSHGPQYRRPTPDTPRDSISILHDRNSDGTADAAHVFATGFNCIQSLAWHGRELWVANAPDLTVVRDTNGDDVADEYIRVFTDLGNIEHGIHGLTWAPDGKLYMTKGNSKGVAIKEWKKNEPDRIAPRPFRELWGVPGPPDAPDFPPAKVFTAATYKNTYQDPDDDWGRMGGILRCDDMGKNLEIVARGCRNPYGLGFDHEFNWLAVDQDQNEGDRIIMPFYGADFGWGHPWSAHWTGENHLPTVPVSGPVFQGSATGVTFANAPNWPESYRGVWLINDWLLKKTYLYLPVWQGALMQPKNGKLQDFITGKNSLFRPVDIAFGADGALYITGWGRGYGAEYDAGGNMTNEGRIFRIVPKRMKPLPLPERKLTDMSVKELIGEFGSLLPLRRINAQDELVQRGTRVIAELKRELIDKQTDTAKTTWILWTLGRIGVETGFFVNPGHYGRTEAQFFIQSMRILATLYADDLRRSGERDAAPVLRTAVEFELESADPQRRVAAVETIHTARATGYMSRLLVSAAKESDRIAFFAIWRAMRDLGGQPALRPLLNDSRGGVRCAALLGLLDLGAMKPGELEPLTQNQDDRLRSVALLGLGKPQQKVAVAERDAPDFPLAANIIVESGRSYSPALLRAGGHSYTDRPYAFEQVPAMLIGAQILCTANDDDTSGGQSFLTFNLALPCAVMVAHDIRLSERPEWMRDFADTDLTVSTNDTTFHLWSKEFPAGKVTLGGNLAGPVHGAKSNYFVVLKPVPPANPSEPTSTEAVMNALPKADPRRGEALFFHNAACAQCHRVGQRGINLGPELTDLGDRMEAKFMVQSMLQPSAVITEGFASHYIEAAGQSYQGVLLSTGKTLRLGAAGGQLVEIAEKDITKHETLSVSPMPPLGAMLGTQEVADVTAWLLALRQPKTPATEVLEAAKDAISAEQKSDRLVFKQGADAVGEFVFKDAKTLRPFFANLRVPGGIAVTRTWPPVAGVDLIDHSDMHPGLWLAFGVVSGEDFWRNKAAIRHDRFIDGPAHEAGSLVFATQSTMLTADGTPLAGMRGDFSLTPAVGELRITWASAITPLVDDFYFGDQEEMGLGVRVATPLSEKKGGLITSSTGVTSASATWGQTAEWCDYSGTVNGMHAGVKIIPDTANFRPCWWHNRDYGVFVANPYGRAAMKQGGPSRVEVKKGNTHRMKFTIVLHAKKAHAGK